MTRFRNEYRDLSDEEKQLVIDIKDFADKFAIVADSVPNGREKSIAFTKLEEAVMWAVKATTG